MGPPPLRDVRPVLAGRRCAHWTGSGVEAAGFRGARGPCRAVPVVRGGGWGHGGRQKGCARSGRGSSPAQVGHVDLGLGAWRCREETGSREMGSGVGGGDRVPVPWDLSPHMCGEGIVAPGLLPPSTVPPPGTHALCPIGLNERGFATVEPGFGAVCDVP